jgi:NAD+ synthase (glutamine-hydrolysing)
MFGMVKVAACSPVVHVGDVKANVAEINKMLVDPVIMDSAIIVFPELSLTGYTCGDLFGQSKLIDDAIEGLFKIIVQKDQTVIVGMPVKLNGSLYNCAVVLGSDNMMNNKIIGIVPKQFLPNYKEFYEQRWFSLADGSESKTIDFLGQKSVPFGTDLLFKIGFVEVKFGVEICEDAWVPIPPSCFQSLAGAQLLINISASNELVGKADYRRELVKNQSARCMAGYIYCSSGRTESTNDLVFSGHSLIAENGSILNESPRFKDHMWIADVIDIQRLDLERTRTGSFSQSKRLLNGKTFREVEASQTIPYNKELIRNINGHPFLPTNIGDRLNDRCWDIFNIQISGLVKCLKSANIKDVHIGVSGGLDSTLALLVAVKAFDQLELDRKGIHGVTMPGFGTSDGTKFNAIELMEQLRISSDEIDIKQLTYDTFKSIKHKPFGIDIEELSLEEFIEELKKVPAEKLHDPVFENTQARVRTLVLMNRGFVLGTGDLSELALGWCTYNGDHMSMYNVNCSVPKTLVKFVVKWVAESNWFMGERNEKSSHAGRTKQVLLDIVNTEISPELLPVGADGKIQSTQDIVGPYELHDFFLFNFVRQGFKPKKILYLAEQVKNFEGKYTREELAFWLKSFLKRFFTNQFKRNCVPNGPKVGSLSLSPRGDWRMPSDASYQNFLEGL